MFPPRWAKIFCKIYHFLLKNMHHLANFSLGIKNKYLSTFIFLDIGYNISINVLYTQVKSTLGSSILSNAPRKIKETCVLYILKYSVIWYHTIITQTFSKNQILGQMLPKYVNIILHLGEAISWKARKKKYIYMYVYFINLSSVLFFHRKQCILQSYKLHLECKCHMHIKFRKTKRRTWKNIHALN